MAARSIGSHFYGRCPGGEGALLKSVGRKWLAGSNPVSVANRSLFDFSKNLWYNIYIKKIKDAIVYASCNMVLSSSGLGHRPFTAATGVQISVASPKAHKSLNLGGFVVRKHS